MLVLHGGTTQNPLCLLNSGTSANQHTASWAGRHRIPRRGLEPPKDGGGCLTEKVREWQINVSGGRKSQCQCRSPEREQHVCCDKGPSLLGVVGNSGSDSGGTPRRVLDREVTWSTCLSFFFFNF